jgi:hypothetical protein
VGKTVRAQGHLPKKRIFDDALKLVGGFRVRGYHHDRLIQRDDVVLRRALKITDRREVNPAILNLLVGCQIAILIVLDNHVWRVGEQIFLEATG